MKFFIEEKFLNVEYTRNIIWDSYISFENVVFNDEENFPINITFSADNFSSIQKIKIKLEKEGLNVSEGKSEKIDNLIIGNIYIK